MPVVVCSVAAFTVASIFYAWRAHYESQFKRQRQLRQRVAMMLWAVADLA